MATDYVYPSENPDAAKGEPTHYIPGIIKRELYAMEILAGLCASPNIVSYDDSKGWFRVPDDVLVAKARALADALIKDLANHPAP
jgi:hypothetical protein